MRLRPVSIGRLAAPALGILALVGLYLSREYNYLLFHSLAEGFSIAVACGIFMLAWNSRRFARNGYLLWLGIAFLFVGGLDMLHALAYKGMDVFRVPGANLATQLWIAARYLEALALLIAPAFVAHHLNARAALAGYMLAVGLLLVSIFAWPVFPQCYDDVLGRLTEFKIGSEFAICGLLVGAAGLLYLRREHFDRSVLLLVMGSIAATIFSELLFTTYTDPYGPANLAGHFLKIVAYYLIYKAVIETALLKPYSLLFRDLKESEGELRQARDGLEERVRERTAELEGEIRVRRSVEEKLRQANELMESAFSNIHILLAYMDPRFNFLRVNEAFAAAHARTPESFVGLNRFDLFPGAGERDIFEQVVATGQPHFAFEEALESFAADGRRTRYWDWSMQPVLGADGRVEALVLCKIDVTQRKAAQEALRRSEEQFRLLVENARDAIYRLRLAPRLSFEYLSPAVTAMTGYSPEEFYADPEMLWRVVHPADREAVQAILADPGSATGPQALRWISKDGSVVWTEQSLTPVLGADGAVVAVEGVARDITERKEQEQRIMAYQSQLRSLASELMLAEERERRRIAADLHDGVGQTLAAARIKIGALSRAHARGAPGGDLGEVRELIEQTIRDTRTLTFELSPPVLYELGLEAALDWLTEQVQQRYGVRAVFRDDGQPKAFDEDVRVMLYRAVRELLVNVAKHAQAESVTVSIRKDAQGVQITVEDDGVGFDPSLLERGGQGRAGFGLFSVRERLEYMGGSVDIQSAAGRGTRVTLTAPLSETVTEGKG